MQNLYAVSISTKSSSGGAYNITLEQIVVNNDSATTTVIAYVLEQNYTKFQWLTGSCTDGKLYTGRKLTRRRYLCPYERSVVL